MNFEADGPKQQKTTLDSTPVSKEQDTEAIIHTGSTKLDNRGLETCAANKSAPTMWCSHVNIDQGMFPTSC